MEDRKARLQALAAKAGRIPSGAQDNNSASVSSVTAADPDEAETTASSQRLTFRNYTPANAKLAAQKEEEDPAPKRIKKRLVSSPEKNEPSEEINNSNSGKSALEQALEEAQAELPNMVVEHDFAAMAPKKINWDLKRDIQPKLDKLEKRTQKAIVELLRARLEKEASEGLDS
jgi:coiled-coil domain-containing protein 12